MPARREAFSGLITHMPLPRLHLIAPFKAPRLCHGNEMGNIDFFRTDMGTGFRRMTPIDAGIAVKRFYSFVLFPFAGVHHSNDTGQHGIGA